MNKEIPSEYIKRDHTNKLLLSSCQQRKHSVYLQLEIKKKYDFIMLTHLCKDLHHANSRHPS